MFRVAAMAFVALVFSLNGAWASPDRWKAEWPKTDFSQRSVEFNEILSGGPPKDGIPAIDAPSFSSIAENSHLGAQEPVISLSINGDHRAYPLRILTWHEIVNDQVGGKPVTITFCPLCNAGIVFARKMDGGVILDFGTTGKLRNSDLVMYDRQSESWWQQFSGEGIVGVHTGKRLTILPSRLEAFERFAKRHPGGKVLVPNDPNLRDYGRNPYASYDSAKTPFLYFGDVPKNISPMARVVVVNDQAWSLALLQKKGTIETGGVELKWTEGQNSALDHPRISQGRDVGNVTVTKNGEDAVHHITFAFVFKAFKPESEVIVK